MRKSKKIGVLTSGGDAPGMNAAIRGVVRTARHHDIKVVGIKRGFEGLISGDIEELDEESVSGIIQSGGTVLKTARSAEMMTEEGRDKAAKICGILNLDALFIIGGNGSMMGALELSKRGVNVFGIPGTIDLDLDCTDYTIGFDTAVNTGMEAMNKIRDTSSSHERCSIVEVMGRNAGFIALWCALTGGAEEVLLPEFKDVSTESVISTILENRAQGKTHNLIVVAEGIGGSAALAKEIETTIGVESRATILGYLQRGGSPTAVDRFHASVMAYLAVDAYVNGEKNRIVVYKEGKHITLDLDEALKIKRTFDQKFYDMVKILAI